jgi:hypothetical protein
MKRKGAQGLLASQRVTAAANEDFSAGGAGLDGLDRLEYPRTGWDPYEVWRTRVKTSTTRATPQRERDRLR